VGTLVGSETQIGRSKAPALRRELLETGPSRIKDDRKLQTDDPDLNSAIALLVDQGRRSHRDLVDPRYEVPGSGAHVEPATRAPSLRKEPFGNDAVIDGMVTQYLPFL